MKVCAAIGVALTVIVLRALQNERFVSLVEDGWRNPFYRRRWQAAGLEPGDIKSLDDIVKLPMFNSDDIKHNQSSYPPFGDIQDISPEQFSRTPLKIHTSGGTTGTPRPTLFGPIEWEVNANSCARGLHLVGGRPGDIIQIPSTCSLANVGAPFSNSTAPWIRFMGGLPMKPATNRFAGCPYTSAGLPNCCTMPPFMTATWSDIVMASS